MVPPRLIGVGPVAPVVRAAVVPAETGAAAVEREAPGVVVEAAEHVHPIPGLAEKVATESCSYERPR